MSRKRLRGVPEVRALYSTNGRWDFVAELEDRDLASFDETLRRLRLIDGINSTETNILLNARKRALVTDQARLAKKRAATNRQNRPKPISRCRFDIQCAILTP